MAKTYRVEARIKLEVPVVYYISSNKEPDEDDLTTTTPDVEGVQEYKGVIIDEVIEYKPEYEDG